MTNKIITFAKYINTYARNGAGAAESKVLFFSLGLKGELLLILLVLILWLCLEGGGGESSKLNNSSSSSLITISSISSSLLLFSLLAFSLFTRSPYTLSLNSVHDTPAQLAATCANHLIVKILIYVHII